jgi:hypothetical protein
MSPAVFVLSMLSDYYTGNFFLLIWIVYVLLPLVDYILPVDHQNVPEHRVKILEKDTRFMVPLYLVWVLDLGIVAWSIYKVSAG